MYLYSLYLRLFILLVGALLLWLRGGIYQDDDPLAAGAKLGNRIMYFGGFSLIALSFLLSLIIENPYAWLREAGPAAQ